MKASTIFAASFAALTALTVTGHARAQNEPRASMRTEKAEQVTDRILSESTELYRALVSGNEIPQALAESSQCIAVIPDVKTAALAVGGTHGDGVAFCRTYGGQWSRPIFIDMTGASIGLQAGLKSADYVLFMTANDSKHRLERDELQLSGSLSAVAGSFQKGFTPPREGTVAFTRSGGLFAGASLGTVMIRRDNGDQRAFYGTSTPYTTFEGGVPEKKLEAASAITDLLPKTKATGETAG